MEYDWLIGEWKEMDGLIHNLGVGNLPCFERQLE